MISYLKILLFSIICYILGVLQSYFGLSFLKDKMSSVCMDCSFLEEILYSNLIILFPILILCVILKIFKTKINLFAILVIIFFSTLSIIVNRDIFNAREASWSTYLDSEITSASISSLLPTIFISWGIIFFILKFLFKNTIISNPSFKTKEN